MPLFNVFVGLQSPAFSKKCSVVCDAVSSAGDFWVGKGTEGCFLSWAAALDTGLRLRMFAQSGALQLLFTKRC